MKKELTVSKRVEPAFGVSTRSHIEGVTWSLARRRLFMTSALDDRRRILAEQARDAVRYYERDQDSEAWQGGDIVES